MKSTEIRKKFFDYFVKHGHEKVASSPLIPAQDPTILFTNAGMNQFKDLFLGNEKRSYTKAVTIQKCTRAGGKHNDLDNVGFTKRHLTFFEMMGNFSFGNYFKEEAIPFAWELLTEGYGLDKSKLHISVFEKDDESYNIWKDKMGIPEDKLHRLGAVDNFWQMGDIGPCGPCTEIYIDLGTDKGCGSKDCKPGCECDRFLELWNLVFMQYERQPDGSDKPLKQTGVDTGMGIERIAAVLQNKDSVYGTDLFANIIKGIEKFSGKKYKDQDAKLQAAFHVLADHIRSSSLLIADGCSPSNEGRGYVLRKIIRRAALFEQKLSNKSFFPKLVSAVVLSLGDVYPDLKQNQKLIENILESEVSKFSENLVRGKNILEGHFQENKDKIISGEQAFRLYDTFGFPIEVTEIYSNENNFKVDAIGFEKEMEKQRLRSGKKMKNTDEEAKLPETMVTKFTGYESTKTSTKLIGIIQDNELIDSVKAGSDCWIITEESPFFVANGGQVDDTGTVEINGKITDLLGLKKIDNARAIQIKAPTDIKVGDRVECVVNKEIRINTMKNHTATHLLQAALIEMFGKQVKQSGSIVTPDYLRFDFTFHRNLTPEEIKTIEKKVNDKIRDNIALEISQTTHKKAVAKGVIAIFGEKYNLEKVRVVDVPGFSAELCGGTHVPRTGDIGTFKLTEMSALSAGNRRVFAVTGPKAIELFQDEFETIRNISQEFKIKPEEVLETILKQKEDLQKAEVEIRKLKKSQIDTEIPSWLSKVDNSGKVPFLYLVLEDYDMSELRDISQKLIAQKPGFYFLLSNQDDKSFFLAAVAKEHKADMDLKKMGAWLNKEYSLRGGGKDLVIQGGGPKLTKDLSEEIKKQI
jgi:alanyl-tRNA synthetase